MRFGLSGFAGRSFGNTGREQAAIILVARQKQRQAYRENDDGGRCHRQLRNGQTAHKRFERSQPACPA